MDVLGGYHQIMHVKACITSDMNFTAQGYLYFSGPQICWMRDFSSYFLAPMVGAIPRIREIKQGTGGARWGDTQGSAALPRSWEQKA